MDIEHLRKFCLSLPHVTEDIKWENDLCFCIAGKMFCIIFLSESEFRVSFKVKVEDFDELTASSNIIPAPYVARYKWIQVLNPSRFSQKEWEQYLRQSYALVRSKLPKKILQSLEQ